MNNNLKNDNDPSKSIILNYYSTKKFGPITTSHRQWRDKGSCKFIHGYARYIEVTFACSYLNEQQWVMDFGGLNKLNDWLHQQWDHRLLISSDDPLLQDFKMLHDKDGCNLNIMDINKGWGPGIESSCKFVLDYADNWIKQLTSNRVLISKIQIWEHEKNSAILSIE